MSQTPCFIFYYQIVNWCDFFPQGVGTGIACIVGRDNNNQFSLVLLKASSYSS